MRKKREGEKEERGKEGGKKEGRLSVFQRIHFSWDREVSFSLKTIKGGSRDWRLCHAL